MGALSDIRVIDLAGPLAEMTGRTLADLGAEVIKVEPPGGCESRRLPPFDATTNCTGGESLYWRAFGRGKHSVVLDLDAATDRATFDELVRGADIIVVSDPPSALDARGLGPESIAALNASMLYVSVTPFGRTGPEAESPATDLTLAAAGGFLNCQGDRDRPPVPIGVPETSHSAAVQAAADAVCALFERDRSGLGQVLDASMQAAAVGTLLYIVGFGVQGLDAPAMGDDRADPATNAIGLTIPVFARTADGFLGMTLLMGKPGARSLGRMMAWAGAEGGLDADLAEHDWSEMVTLIMSGSITPGDAQRGIDQLVAFFGTRTKHEIHDRGVAGRWLVAPAKTAEDLLADSQLVAREFWVDVEGTPHPGPFAKLSRTPIRYDRPAPALGADQQVVAQLRTPSAPPPSTGARPPIFEGLKVADFSWVGAGPLISRELSNLGATVLRMESESHIDPLRIIPPWKDGVPDHRTGHCMANFNQSKLGLALDLGVPEAREVIDRLVGWADVVIESFVPGTAARFGLDADTVLARRPDMVMMSSCMRGQTGPERGYTGFGLQGAALAGFVAVTGWADRMPAGPFAAYSDFLAPRFSLAALAAAIRHRRRTGEGQYIDLSQVEAAMHVIAPMILDYAVNGRVAGLRGTDSDRACPHGVYRTAGTERYVAIAVESAAQWRALRAATPGLAGFDTPEFDSLEHRISRRIDIESALTDVFVEEDRLELAARLRTAGVPAYAVLRATDLVTDPQLAHRGHFVELDHPVIGPQRYEAAVTRLSATPHRPTHAGPAIGQHTHAALSTRLGYTDDEITELAAAGVLT